MALLAAIVCFAACQPHENNIELGNVRNIVYTVDRNTNSVTLQNNAEWDALLERLLDYAAEGSTVSFYNADRVAKGASKDVVEYSTTSRDEMKAWMVQMEDAGMTVTVTYDPVTGTWHGTAYTTAPQPPAGTGVATYVNPDYGSDLSVIVTIDSLNRTAYVNYDVDNYWLHMPCGVFHDIHEEDGRLILSVWESQNGSDTLYIGRNHEDSLIISFAYSGICPANANHTHECFLVPAPQGLQTWYCSSPYDIILGLYPYAIDTYPEIGLAQICAPMAGNINCIAPFWTGNCEMIRYFTNRTDVDWELSLRYTYNNDSSYYIVDSLGVSGYPDDSHATMPMVIHDLHQYPGCASHYMFNRIN